MSQIKRASKGKRSNRALTALSVAGVSLAATAASSAAVLSPVTVPAMPLGEEEISGVTLATFHLLDQEKAGAKDDLLQLTGCRGCGGMAARLQRWLRRWRQRLRWPWLPRWLGRLRRLRRLRLRWRLVSVVGRLQALVLSRRAFLVA